MAEMLVQSESLTAIADKIRVLSGTTDDMSLDDMVTHVDDANSELGVQSELLEQVVAAIEGKASSDGGNIDTCTVIIRNTHTSGYLISTVATIFDGHNLSYYNFNNDLKTQEITIENVVCGSVIVTNVSGYSYVGFRLTGATYINNIRAFHITANSGETVIIEFYYND